MSDAQEVGFDTVLHGTAQVQVDERAEVLMRDGAHVAEGSRVRTDGETPATLAPANGLSVRLAPHSAVSLKKAAWLPGEQGTPAVRAYQVMLTSGDVDVDVRDASGLAVTVLLPGERTFSLWRGSGHVGIHDGQVTAAVYTGMAIAGSPRHWTRIGAASSATLLSQVDPVPHALLTSPTWVDGSASHTFALVKGFERASVGAAWKAVPNAASYQVEVVRQGQGRSAFIETSGTSMQTEPLASGAYVARVRAVGRDGVVGQFSSPLPIRVARLVLPPSAAMRDDGTIVLGPSDSVTLDDPRDLEMAVGNDTWIAAPAALSLRGDERRDVRLRGAQSHLETHLALVARQLRARVSFSPTKVRWPDQPLDIAVKVEDPSGYIDPAREPVQIDVAIDLDRARLSWTHVGDTWRTRLAPIPGRAPTVVRVDVKDRGGASIGASLIDIDGPPRTGDAGAERVTDSR